MKINLSAQPIFNFLATITTLQRGKEDPVSLFENETWYRCFQLGQNRVLLSTSYREELEILLHTGMAKEQEILRLISGCIGLDDPLLNQTTEDSRLDQSWGIAVPGYPGLFEALIQTLFGQLVSVPVANQMRRRFVLAFGKTCEHDGKIYYLFPEAEDIASRTEEEFRTVGTSRMKVRSIIEIARAFTDQNLEEKIRQAGEREHQYKILGSTYGIGRWTIDWVMLRALRQFDVVPVTDLAVRKAVTWFAQAENLLSDRETAGYAERFSPYAGSMIYRILCAYVKAQNQQKLIV